MKANRKTREGVVVSNKMSKTVVVAVERRAADPRFKKIMRYANRFKAHDEKNACSIGDIVQIIETHPISKDKRWRVQRILVKAASPETETAAP